MGRNGAKWGEENAVLEQAARLTLAIGLKGVTLRLKENSVKTLWRPVVFLLTLVMLGMWLASSVLAGWLFGLPLWTALLLGAVITPTDPVVASSIMTGKFAKENLPVRVRDTISFESGANDGLAYAFVMLAVLMIGQPPGVAWERWLTESLLIGVIGASIIGGAVGYIAAKLLKAAETYKIIEVSYLLGYTIAFSLFTLGAAELLGADALISVFLAGLVFNLCTERPEEHEERHIQEAVAKLFTLPMFVIFGIALPFAEWARLGWPLLALAVLVLLLRRPPVVAASLPVLRGPLKARDVAYLGWFGPIGIAAIYYATFAHGQVHDPIIWHAASALVFASILIHGVTAAPFTRLYSHRARTRPQPTLRQQEKRATPRGSEWVPEVPALEKGWRRLRQGALSITNEPARKPHPRRGQAGIRSPASARLAGYSSSSSSRCIASSLNPKWWPISWTRTCRTMWPRSSPVSHQ